MERLLFLAASTLLLSTTGTVALQVDKEEDWGEGLKVLATYLPERCEHRARTDDVIHYHYVGRLASTGEVFGKSFDYNSPYIVALGQQRIIAGMDRGLMDMCLWERRRITIPPHLGYGERGVGQIIPPNATLVFYVRMIKIERNGATLGAKEGLEDLWKQGLRSYTDKLWGKAVESMEEGLRLYQIYQNATRYCLKSCADIGLQLSKKQQQVVDRMTSDDPLLHQFLVYSARAKCIRECKVDHLPPVLRQPDPTVLQRFHRREPYAYLHYAYYKLDNLEEATKCAYTYFFHNPNDSMATDSISYYRRKLNLTQGQFVFREAGELPHHVAYSAGKEAYQEHQWLKAVDNMEAAVKMFLEAMEDCRLMCEDIVLVNLTQSDSSADKQEKLEREGLLPDSIEWHQLMLSLVRSLLECRTLCHDKMATINGDYHDKYLSGHFDYLQYAYFKLGLMKKATVSAATFLALEPSSAVMASNIKYYRSTLDIPEEDFTARKDIVLWQRRWETEQSLLHYAITGQPRKRQGTRGDGGSATLRHEEL